MSDEQTKIANLEKAISKKYGAPAIENPRKFWTDEKEREYVEQSRKFAQRMRQIEEKSEKVEQDGFLINKKLLTKDTNRECSLCGNYSFDVRNSFFMNKYECCRGCYVNWIEGREERWAKGWRPKL